MGVGTVIDGVYVLGRKLGQGGMAAVYLAEVDQLRFDYTALYAYTQVQGDSHLERRQKAEELAGKLSGKTLDAGTIRALLIAQDIPVPGERVAVKVAVGEADPARFETEWKSLLCLNHPNVVQVYGGGSYMGRPYYSMELFAKIVPPKKVKAEFTIAQKLHVIIQAARGLAYLHANGIVHRDVKPDNAVVCETESGEFVTKITDLGIAKQLEADGMTVTRTAMGTPHYMSPEQIASSKDVDARADIYSLGATMYELLAGVRPYHDKTTVYEVFRAITLHTPPIPPAQHNPDLPEPITAIIECAMAWDVDCRYQKMAELIKDVEKYLAEEDAAVTRAVTFDAASKAKSRAHLGKGKYAFERYRLKAAARAASAKPSPAAAGAGAAGKSASAVPARKPSSGLLIGLGISAVVALIAGIAFMYHAASRPPPAPVSSANTQPGAPASSRAPGTTEPTGLPTTPAQPESDPAVAPLHAALKAKNPQYNGQGQFKFENGAVTQIVLDGTGGADLSPLHQLKPRKLSARNTGVTSLFPLATMPLVLLSIEGSPVADLVPITGMATLRGLAIDGTKVTDLTPLQGMPLEQFAFTPATITTGLDIVRNMKTIKGIGSAWDQRLPPAEFWQKYDAGGFGNAPAAEIGKFIPLATSAADLGAENWARSSAEPVWADGGIRLTAAPGQYAGLLHRRTGRNMILRAQVKKTGGEILGMRLRDTQTGANYVCKFEKDSSFSIDKTVNNEWSRIHTAVSAQSHDGFFDLAFSAIGDRLRVFVDKQLIMEVDDDAVANGHPGISVSSGVTGDFRYLELMLLPDDAPADADIRAITGAPAAGAKQNRGASDR
ncbi:MAG: hypothetical protein A3K19_03820 [Lentisphaerae bacterium RIFOXYB12_FULL_65_16]|nr:MAG: hypothetical protein A3K18_03045 [Lentisphaerae bacterium RIFOXYA12_64_32]OGV89272.1 MAG: hypothetical protein A3K19_03820 [Lentisphaerae bacterium RIFOXYB12_FULL_65_16]